MEDWVYKIVLEPTTVKKGKLPDRSYWEVFLLRGILVSALVLLLVLPVTMVSGENEGILLGLTGSRPAGSFPPKTIEGDENLEDFITMYNFSGNGTVSNPYFINDLDLAPGTYELRFIMKGYKIHIQEIEIKPGSETLMGEVYLERIDRAREEENGSDGKWIILVMIFLLGGLISIGTFLFIYINRGKDESIELERDDEDYLVERGSEDEEYVKHEGSIEQAKRDLW
jgi:hypothetical protein